jgi:hypothetical protein
MLSSDSSSVTLSALGLLRGIEENRLLAIEPAELYGCAEDAAALFVQHGHGQFAAGKASLQGLGSQSKRRT